MPELTHEEMRILCTGGDMRMTVGAIYRGLDIITIVLLLTGQITIAGVFLAPDSFALSLSGPLTGGGPVGTSPKSQLVLDGLDVIAAILLILDQINVVGTYITSARFTIVVGGPPFGGSPMEAYNPYATKLFMDYQNLIFDKYPMYKRPTERR